MWYLLPAVFAFHLLFQLDSLLHYSLKSKRKRNIIAWILWFLILVLQIPTDVFSIPWSRKKESQDHVTEKDTREKESYVTKDTPHELIILGTFSFW